MVNNHWQVGKRELLNFYKKLRQPAFVGKSGISLNDIWR